MKASGAGNLNVVHACRWDVIFILVFAYYMLSVPPHFSKPDQMRKRNLMRPIENSVRLKCKATGKPKPDIIWLKDGEILDVVDNEESKWTLRLSNLQKEDSGKYTCRVFNRAGSINYTYTLEVIGKPVFLCFVHFVL